MTLPANHTLSTALVQFNSRLLDLQANLKRHIKFATEAIEKGAKIIVFPELSLSGYNLQDAVYDVAISEENPIFDELKPLSQFASLLIGFPERGSDGELYNSACLIEAGKVKIAHRKRYLPTYNVFDESRFFTRGNDISVIDTAVGKIGVLICEDSWHPSLAYLLAHQGMELLIIMAASPYRSELASETLDISSKWKIICQSYATTLSLPVVFCNRTGSEDGILFWGGSASYKAGGQEAGKLPLFEEGVLFSVFSAIDRNRERFASSHFLDEDLLWQHHQLGKILR
ncbi:MAG: acyltransferase [Bacteroidetes bacterium]|nr:acyltransferase [Bacteroidota bacterium]